MFKKKSKIKKEKFMQLNNPHHGLIEILPKNSGRDVFGHISARHRGGRQKRYYRFVDFKRDKHLIVGRVTAVEYDPNRNCRLALISYHDGEKRYILAPIGLIVGDQIMSGENVEIKIGNALPISKIPVGTEVHNIEIAPGKGGVLARGAGGAAKILAKNAEYVTIKLPSTESRMIPAKSMATVGVLSNPEHKNEVIGKAGANRWRGRRPEVRGTAQNPRTHPHGGGEGRSGEGMKQPKTPWGKPARGLRTRKKNKYSSRYIVERRKK